MEGWIISLVGTTIHSLSTQALKNLVNKTGQIAVEIFNDLDRRLKSTDKKDTIGDQEKGKKLSFTDWVSLRHKKHAIFHDP